MTDPASQPSQRPRHRIALQDRYQAVEEILAGKWTATDAARAFGVSLPAVYYWMRNHPPCSREEFERLRRGLPTPAKRPPSGKRTPGGPRKARKPAIPFDQRQQAVEQILRGEKKQLQVACELGISRQAVHQWVARAQQGDLEPPRRGRPRMSLDSHLEPALREALASPGHGLVTEHAQWNLPRITAWVNHRQDRPVSIGFMRRYLRGLDLHPSRSAPSREPPAPPESLPEPEFPMRPGDYLQGIRKAQALMRRAAQVQHTRSRRHR